MKHFLILTSIVFLGCGTDEKQSEPATNQNPDYAMVVEEIPDCNLDNNKQLIYVKPTKELQSCEYGKWILVEVKGVKGERGEKGDNGIGKDGIDGNDVNIDVTEITVSPSGQDPHVFVRNGSMYLVPAKMSFENSKFACEMNGWRMTNMAEVRDVLENSTFYFSMGGNSFTETWFDSESINPQYLKYQCHYCGTLLQILERADTEIRASICIKTL